MLIVQTTVVPTDTYVTTSVAENPQGMEMMPLYTVGFGVVLTVVVVAVVVVVAGTGQMRLTKLNAKLDVRASNELAYTTLQVESAITSNSG
jgi:hypothetical protein